MECVDYWYFLRSLFLFLCIIASSDEPLDVNTQQCQSFAEGVNGIHLSLKREYISQEAFDKFYAAAELLFAKTTKFRNSIIDR